MSGVLVLMSGGIDSMTLAAAAQAQQRLAACLHISWGQPAANRESRASQGWCDAQGVSLLRAKVPLVADAMTHGDGPRVVPGRNLAFIAVAVGYAKQVGAREIWYGATLDDARDYADCRVGWIQDLNKLLLSEGVKARAPFVGSTKADVVHRALTLGVDLSQSFSCYAPLEFEVACGECNSCLARHDVLTPEEP